VRIVGTFDPKERIIQWLFSDNSDLALNTYNKILNLNILSGAFYPWEVSTSDVELKGIVNLAGFQTIETIEEIEVGDESVDAGDEQVIIRTSDRQPTASTTIYAVFVPGEG